MNDAVNMEIVESKEDNDQNAVDSENTKSTKNVENIENDKDSKDKMNKVTAPLFTTTSWGVLNVMHDGKEHTFKDAVLTPSGASGWNWKLDGTRHKPGVTVKAIEMNNLFDADYVILTKGVDLVLKITKSAADLVAKAKAEGKIVDYKILQSTQAFQEYNEMVNKGMKVSGLFHSTC